MHNNNTEFLGKVTIRINHLTFVCGIILSSFELCFITNGKEDSFVLLAV